MNLLNVLNYPCILLILKTLDIHDLHRIRIVCRTLNKMYKENVRKLVMLSKFNTLHVRFTDSRELYIQDKYFWKIQESIKEYDHNHNQNQKHNFHECESKHDSLYRDYIVYRGAYDNTINKLTYKLMKIHTAYNAEYSNEIIGDYYDIRSFFKCVIKDGEISYNVILTGSMEDLTSSIFTVYKKLVK